MLLFELRAIGNKLFEIRKSMGLTQAEVAERTGLCDRTYADIERGTVNMRVETVLRICQALGVTPNDFLTDYDHGKRSEEEGVLSRLDSCSPHQRDTALRLLKVYLDSVM